MRVHVVRVPYDAGNRGVRMGKGPERLGGADRLRSLGADVTEPTAVEGSRLGWVTVPQIRKEGAAAALQPVLSRLTARRIHVHVDLDVHDPALAPANEFAPPGGLTPREVQDAVRAIGAALPICSASIGAYDPSADPEGRALAAGQGLIEL